MEEEKTAVGTQRAYTLRLGRAPGKCAFCGKDPCDCWREALRETHEIFNRGVRIFGDWLLTLRGGLSHELVELPVREKGFERDRRVLLALCWLSVEDEEGAPREEGLRVASGRESPEACGKKVIAALREILQKRGLGARDLSVWEEECRYALTARIREDSVWVNRSLAFDRACDRYPGLDRGEARKIVERFFGELHEYLSLPSVSEDDEGAPRGASQREEGPHFREIARGWISEHFGTGRKCDMGAISRRLEELAGMDWAAFEGKSGVDLAEAIAQKTGVVPEEDLDETLKKIRREVGWVRGRKSRGCLEIERACGKSFLKKEDLESLKEVLQEEIQEKRKKAQRGPPPWMERWREDLERELGVRYVSGRNLTGEFSSMLDQAARRVSARHSWIRRREAERRTSAEKAASLRELRERAPEAVAWLDRYCERRSEESGSRTGYRIRRRAIEAWAGVVEAWSSPSCRNEEDRIAAVRELQSDLDVEKFGDASLFEDLASEEAVCVWRSAPGAPDSSILRNYVEAREKEADCARFRVPSYRHPDPWRHPVFCEFGNSRWKISFPCHRAVRKEVKGRSREAAAGDREERLWKVLLGLWDGKNLREIPLRWSSKRLVADLALDGETGREAVEVPRADRLGRAAAGSPPAVRVTAPFREEHWNGRLQVPRGELSRVAFLLRRGKKERAEARIRRLRWYLTFSPRLKPRGPFLEYAAKHGLPVDRRGKVHLHQENKERGELVRLHLCRLPGLRVLAVDLGHRFAAACAVWETLSSEAFWAEIRDLQTVAGGSGPEDRYLIGRRFDPGGKPRTVVYRRLGPEVVEGRPHPAPWARLDRQFLIKLDGEETPARKASPQELEMVAGWKKALGKSREEGSPPEKLPRRVDLLMEEAVRVFRQALRRHGVRARIALNLTAREKKGPGGEVQALDRASRVELLTRTLWLWQGLFAGSGWRDAWAQDQWRLRGLPEIPPAPEREGLSPDRRARRRELENFLRPHAERLADQDLSDWAKDWEHRWREDDERWRGRDGYLRRLRSWIAPRGLRSLPSDDEATAARKKEARAAIRHVGGLSLTRIGTITGLYRLLKAFGMRLRPGPEGQGGGGLSEKTGRRLLEIRDRLREQRVKQTASRILEAALGLGGFAPAREGGHSPARPKICVNRPCHAIVTEYLKHYRPDEVRTRGENRRLMEWCSARLEKFLEEGCLLYGLYWCRVSPRHTSRQCSRTGLPGVRCEEVSLKTFRSSSLWLRYISAAERRLRRGKGDALDRYLADLGARLREGGEEGLASVIRVPRPGGPLFVAAPAGGSGDPGGAHPHRILQADLNAAANIGLRALMDPDWPGGWWFVPCRVTSGEPVPLERNTRGGDAFEGIGSLPVEEGEVKGKEGKVMNFWRDPEVSALTSGGRWMSSRTYWDKVRDRVAVLLRRMAGL